MGYIQRVRDAYAAANAAADAAHAHDDTHPGNDDCCTAPVCEQLGKEFWETKRNLTRTVLGGGER